MKINVRFLFIVTLATLGLCGLTSEAQENTNFPESSASTLPNIEAVSDANQKIASSLKEGSVATEIVGNFVRLSRYYTNIIQRIPVHSRIWNVSLLYYTKEFAQQKNVPTNLITDLPKGIEVISYTQRTVGDGVRCNLNVLLDQNLGIALPKDDYQGASPDQVFYFPRSLGPNKSLFPNFTPEKWPTGANYALATLDHRWNGDQMIGGVQSTIINYYMHNYYDGYDYFSFNIGCNTSSILASGKASLWLKKEGGADYTKTTFYKPDDFLKLPLPKVLVDVAVPLMRETESLVKELSPDP